ncbi:hypothetical protein O181_040475 [Austropuccinia psidii MF-1]|uniref:Uncharacterized protein n=1 Tax=Austropuccinia psidii MF-1 TaxID=1389203 RepID=A0A9Q3DD86_9BASI|nr:hypothetical protein [Austropuccinia psidii MF-1]
MWSQLCHLPDELLLQVLENVELVENETIDELSSPFYWCLMTSQLPAAWSERLKMEKLIWKKVTLPLCQINQVSRDLMIKRVKSFTIGSSRSFQRRMSRQPTHFFHNDLNMRMFNENVMSNEVWKMIMDYAQSLQLLTFDVQNENTYGIPGLAHCEAIIDGFDLSIFPNLTSFTFRTASPDNWISHLAIKDLVKASPHLRSLTVFHLHADLVSDQDLDPELYGEPEPDLEEASCQLISLHLRRFRHCHEQNILSFILSKSHETLQELTLVFAGPNSRTDESQRFHRGVGANEVQAAFAPCKKLHTLRVADQVAGMSDYATPRQEVELDPEEGPLGFILDNMVRHLKDLKVLEMCGGIFSMDLFNNLKLSDCRLELLSIRNYPQFPISSFIEQLRSNKALSHLEKIELGSSMLCSTEEKIMFSVCQRLQLELKLLPDY